MKLAIIPARGRSKRIPNKNIISFCGKPMMSYAIDAAKNSNIFDHIHVSTDSKEVARVAAKLGCPVDFFRDDSLADDFTGLLPVIQWVVEQYIQRGDVYDEIFCIMPCSPLLQYSDIVNAFTIFEENNKKKPLLVFAKYPVPIDWAFLKSEDGLMHAKKPKMLLERSQDLEGSYYECGPFSIWKKEHLYDESTFSQGVLSYVLSADRAIDIDTVEDLDRAKHMYKIIYSNKDENI